NSIEAMRHAESRELVLSTGRMEPGFVEVSVRDTGSGLPPDVSARLFQPFTTTKEDGLGIGLTICRSILEAHQGRIWVAEGLALGTEFHFRLPVEESVEAA